MIESLHERIIAVLRHIPAGRVATYGQIATLVGNPRAARQVVRALHTASRKEELPWHRVINSKGEISLPPGRGREEQTARLRAEGISVNDQGRVDLATYQWPPGARDTRSRRS